MNLPQQTSVLLQLWDVGGHNLASLNMLNTYIFGAQAVLFVYDVTSNQSFENLTDWVSIAKKVAKQLEKPFYMALVGNRTDDEHRRVIRVEKHSKFAEQHAMQSHFYVSAKTGDSIELTFKKVAAEILGITYSKAEQEWNINVVQAQIQAADKSRGLKKQQEEKKAVKDENGAKDASNDFSKANNSVTCSMQ